LTKVLPTPCALWRCTGWQSERGVSTSYALMPLRISLTYKIRSLMLCETADLCRTPTNWLTDCNMHPTNLTTTSGRNTCMCLSETAADATCMLLSRRLYSSLGIRRHQHQPLPTSIVELRLHTIPDLAEWFLVIPVARGFDHLPVLTR